LDLGRLDVGGDQLMLPDAYICAHSYCLFLAPNKFGKILRE